MYQVIQSIIQSMVHCPPARNIIPTLHRNGEALLEEACFPCVAPNVSDTPVWTKLGDKLLTLCSSGSQRLEGKRLLYLRNVLCRQMIMKFMPVYL